MNLQIDEPERQALLLAMAVLSLDRPGWNEMLGKIAEKMNGREMFNEFRQLNEDLHPQPQIGREGKLLTDPQLTEPCKQMVARLQEAKAPVFTQMLWRNAAHTIPAGIVFVFLGGEGLKAFDQFRRMRPARVVG